MPTWVGIDIGSKAVKVAVVKSTYRRTSLDSLASVEINSGPLSTNVQDALALAMTTALGGAVASADSVAVAIDGVRVAVRVLALPQSAQKQLNEVLAFELEAQVPFDMESAVFDHRILGKRPGVEEGQIEVLTTVARTEDVQARIDLVKSATGHDPERVGVGPFPLANLVAYIPPLAEPGPIVVLDLGNRDSELLILQSGEPIFARTLSCGTEGLPDSAAKIARELRLSITAFRAQGGDPPVQAFICGGGAYFERVESYLADQLGIVVERFPLPNIDIATLPPERLTDFARFAKATGLALGLGGRAAGLNLRKGPLAYESGFAWVREKLPLLAGLSCAIFASFFVASAVRLYATGADKATLEKALGAVSTEVLGEQTTSADRAQELLQQQAALIDEDPMVHADAFDVMVKLSEAIPASMKHDVEELDIQKNHVVVHGIVPSRNDAEAIANTLRSERCFSDVNVTRSNQQIGGTAQKYVMEFDIKCPEDTKATKKKDGAPAASAAPSASSGGGK